MAKFETHNFYCINCGNQTLPVVRREGRMKGKFHRKKLYCYHCKQEINCVECRNELEVYDFKKAFEAGEFKKEAEESLQHIKEELFI